MQPSLKLPFPPETLLDALIESIICIDLNRRIVYWSKGAERIYEYTAAEAVGQPYGMLFPGGVEEEAGAMREQGPAMLAGQRSIFQGWRVTKSGRRVYVRVAGSPLFGEDGQHVGFVGHAIDITAHPSAARTPRDVLAGPGVSNRYGLPSSRTLHLTVGGRPPARPRWCPPTA